MFAMEAEQRGNAMRQPTPVEMARCYLRLHVAVGALGVLLPVILVVLGLLEEATIQPSLSDYYHTLEHDIYVGTLFAIGLFLVAYQGYPRSRGELLSDTWITTLAGIGALGVALFPNEVPNACGSTPLRAATLGTFRVAVLHYGSGLVFLLSLAYISLVPFARSAHPSRRRIYRTTGWIIAVMTVAVFVTSWFKIIGPAPLQRIVIRYRLVLWSECIATWAFGVSWLVKGRAERLLGLRRRRGA